MVVTVNIKFLVFYDLILSSHNTDKINDEAIKYYFIFSFYFVFIKFKIWIDVENILHKKLTVFISVNIFPKFLL